MSERASILIVDDAPENLEYLSSILSPIYKVRAASNGERALAIVMSETPPDLILLDIMMPGIDGYEVCRQIKASPVRRSIPIIMNTNHKAARLHYFLRCIFQSSEPVRSQAKSSEIIGTHQDAIGIC